jgi:hypothetical protein
MNYDVISTSSLHCPLYRTHVITHHHHSLHAHAHRLRSIVGPGTSKQRHVQAEAETRRVELRCVPLPLCCSLCCFLSAASSLQLTLSCIFAVPASLLYFFLQLPLYLQLPPFYCFLSRPLFLLFFCFLFAAPLFSFSFLLASSPLLPPFPVFSLCLYLLSSSVSLLLSSFSRILFSPLLPLLLPLTYSVFSPLLLSSLSLLLSLSSSVFSSLLLSSLSPFSDSFSPLLLPYCFLSFSASSLPLHFLRCSPLFLHPLMLHLFLNFLSSACFLSSRPQLRLFSFDTRSLLPPFRCLVSSLLLPLL